MHGCGGAATLTVNVRLPQTVHCVNKSFTHWLFSQVILGDAIVCWRACVIWHKNHVVKAICGVFLLATFGKLSSHNYNSRVIYCEH